MYIKTKNYLEPQTTIYKWMFGETTISYVKIWNHLIESQPFISMVVFSVPGMIDLEDISQTNPSASGFFRTQEDVGLSDFNNRGQM